MKGGGGGKRSLIWPKTGLIDLPRCRLGVGDSPWVILSCRPLLSLLPPVRKGESSTNSVRTWIRSTTCSQLPCTCGPTSSPDCSSATRTCVEWGACHPVLRDSHSNPNLSPTPTQVRLHPKRSPVRGLGGRGLHRRALAPPDRGPPGMVLRTVPQGVRLHRQVSFPC